MFPLSKFTCYRKVNQISAPCWTKGREHTITVDKVYRNHEDRLKKAGEVLKVFYIGQMINLAVIILLFAYIVCAAFYNLEKKTDHTKPAAIIEQRR